ncbi:sigma-70 family RNA polymerase sigma factor [Myxococcota bacterium]|nr:sigma-70 family RNA polymerase sigma factor [Myxococcota bacterium]
MIFEGRRALLDAFRRGDRDALLEVYRAYAADVARFLSRGFTFESDGRPCAFRGFRGGYEIEAAIQEVFRRAFEERARLAYDGLHPYRPYLLRIARNLVINDLKSKQPILFRFRAGRPVVLEPASDDGPEALPSSERSPEDELEASEVARLVAEFLGGLDERERGVFRLRFEEGLAAEVAAEQLGLTRSKVRTTEAKLRARFLEHMRRSGYLTAYREGRAGAAASVAALLLVASWGAG